MRGTFSEILAASWEWTKTILFHPFQIKKWVILGFITLLAGQLTYGCNSQFNFNGPGKESSQQVVTKKENSLQNSSVSPVSSNPPYAKGLLSAFRPMHKIFLVFIIAFPLMVFLLLIGNWLYSRFSFIFIEAIVKNDASVKNPFRNNKIMGNSYFLWNIAIGLVGLAFLSLLGFFGFLSLSRIGVLKENVKIGLGKIILNVLPFVSVLVFLVAILVLLNFIVRNFILPVMYRDKVKIFEAWPRVLHILSANKKDVLLYFLFKIILTLATSVLATSVGVLISIGLVLPIGIVASVFFVGYKLMPVFLHPAYLSVIFIIGVPFLLALAFCVNCFFLPIPVFLQTFNLKFLARIDEKYDLFKMPITEVNR